MSAQTLTPHVTWSTKTTEPHVTCSTKTTEPHVTWSTKATDVIPSANSQVNCDDNRKTNIVLIVMVTVSIVGLIIAIAFNILTRRKIKQLKLQ